MFDELRLRDGDPAAAGAAPAAPPRVEPQMRRLRALVEVAQCRSVNRAAERLHVTQSAVTRAIRGLEESVGLTLFDRSPRGMSCTADGELVVRRTRRALAYLEAAEREVDALLAEQPGRRPARGLVQKLAQRHLQTLGAIADYRTETAAAAHLGITQPAVTLALRDLEEMAGTPAFTRSPRGMLPTPAGELLIRGAKLALAEIAAAGDDLAARLGQVAGRLVVGALPLSGTPLAPRALSRVAKLHPRLRLVALEGAYDELIKGLRCGDVDVVVGGLPPNPPADLAQEKLFEDGLSLVVRRGHPLTRLARPTLADLAGADWVIPYRRTMHRNMVERALLAAGLTLPPQAIEANSATLVRGLLVDSDRVSVLSHRQLWSEDREGLLAVLPIALPGTGLAVGYTTRADAMRTVGLEALLAQLRALVPPALHGAG